MPRAARRAGASCSDSPYATRNDAARGRAFARFETRFQLVWVVGGVLAVLFPGKERGGLFLLALVLLFAGLSYLGTARRLRSRRRRQPSTTVPRSRSAPVRRHPARTVRARPAPAPPPATVTDDPPDAFPAGGWIRTEGKCGRTIGA